VSVLTPTIRGREKLLRECRASVLFQTTGCWEHLRLLDEELNGCAASMNELAAAARGEWLLPLADDDLLLPGCLEMLLEEADGGDVIFSRPLVWGADPRPFWGEPPVIPSFALIRRSLWESLGGYDDEWNREEDRRLWIRALAMGARFVKVEYGPTWVYRFHGGNKSFRGGVAS
jgi:glycosyltransferase involved in cell wall biosynthesis